MPTPASELSIDGRRIGLAHPTYFIADIAANHDGSLDRAIALIRLAATAGADAAKFQHFQAHTIVSDVGFKALGVQQSHQAAWQKSVFDVYRDASVHAGWTPALKAACDDAGIAFFTSPYAFDLVDAVDPFVPAYKIGSGDITWLEMIEYIARRNKPYILATGASSMAEVERAVGAALAINPRLALLQCNTNYTGSLANFGHIELNVLHTFAERFPGVVLGLSDHTPGHATVLGAVALGARIIEKHFTDDVSRVGPDHGFSMDPQSWRDMVDRTRELELALGSGEKRVERNEQVTVVLQRRAIRAARDLPAGTTIAREDVEVLRPCPPDAVDASHVAEVVGRRLSTARARGEHLRWSDLAR